MRIIGGVVAVVVFACLVASITMTVLMAIDGDWLFFTWNIINAIGAIVLLPILLSDVFHSGGSNGGF